MDIDPEFLRKVQRSGWIIRAVDETAVFGSCPREGCQVMVKLRPEASIPDACSRGPDLAEQAVESYDQARVFLRGRRETLGLSIKDVELGIGMADDHLAKFEKDDPSRIPTVPIFVEWAKGLGYEVVLRPTSLPPLMLRIIAETREKLRKRLTHFRIHAARRGSRF